MHAPAEIDRRDGESLVHRHDEVAGAVDAAPVAERGRDRFAERDPEVFDGVVLIDVEVAGGGDRQVERAVAREQLQHVVEEPDAGADVVAAATVERQFEMDLRLGGLPVDHRAAHRTSSMPAMHRCVWATTPVVIRTHPAHP